MPNKIDRYIHTKHRDEILHPWKSATADRRSLVLLILLVIYMILHPFLEGDAIGEIILNISLCTILVAATLELAAKSSWRLPAVILTVLSMSTAVTASILNSRAIGLVAWALVAMFFGLVSTGLFAYLGQSGEVTRGRLYASVSLYFLIGIFWFSIFNFVELFRPGSFFEQSGVTMKAVSRAGLLYFSMCILTTVGYGDMIPGTPATRMMASLEAASGVLYIAITVARLVSGYGANRQRDERA